MTPSYTYFVIFLKILITNGEDTDKTKCDRNISNQGVIEYLCPPSSNGSKTSIHVYSRLLRIDCNNTKVLDAKVLPMENHKNITELKLTKCPLPKNGFKDIVNIFNITNLKSLIFTLANTTNCTLTENEFMGLNELKTLELVQSKISKLDGTIFRNTPKLSSLVLNRNEIKLNDELFDHLPNLTYVSMYTNNINYIPRNIFNRLSKLRRLELWNNNIQYLESGVFDGLVNLKLLLLSQNALEIIDKDLFEDLRNLVSVSLGNNRLKQISRNTFMNCKNIEEIDLRNNTGLILIDDVFSQFEKLKRVNLASNLLENISGTLFNGSVNLRIIQLDNNRLSSLEENIFGGLENLEKLHLESNKIEKLHPDIFSSLKNLKYLYLQDNLINKIDAPLLRNMQSLIEINLNKNKITYVHPESLITNVNLLKFSMSDNGFDFASKDHIFFKADPSSSLREVNLSYNKISIYPEVLSEILTMETVNLKNNSIRTIELVSLLSKRLSLDRELNIILDANNISSILINSDHLNIERKSKTIVTITHNPITCDCNALNLARFLQEDHNLKNSIWFHPSHVTCSGPVNRINEILNKIKPTDLTCRLERKCTKNGDCDCLRRSFDEALIIDCSKRELTDIPQLTPSELSKFYQTEVHLENNRLRRSPREYDGYSNITKLYLQGNEITNLTWIPGSMQVLNLSHNALSYMNGETLKQLNKSRIGNLSLGYNPWRCDCGASEFTEFIRGHINQIDSPDIRCNRTGKSLVNLNRKDLCPTNTELILIMSLIFLTLFLLPAIATSIYFKYKKEILIWLYSRGLCLCLVEEEEIDEDKIYDAFISYSHKDEDFVTDNIISILESGEQPYKLCIHVRDFIPGELIHSQILKSVRASRRTIVILSTSFLESVWGKLEFRTAHNEAMLEGRARVIIIIYGDIDLKSLDDDLKAYIKTNTYVEWGDPWFWKKLRYALPKRDKKSVITSQKHANMMQFINDKFQLMKKESSSNPLSTPPIILDPSQLEERTFTCIA